MDIDSYQARRPEVTAVGEGWIRAFVGDDLPRIDDALVVHSADGARAHAVVRRHAGAREIDAMLLDIPNWLGPGDRVESTGQPARLPAPTPGRTRVDDLAITARQGDDTMAMHPAIPSFAELRGINQALTTGLSPIDRLAPLADGGLTLVLDAHPDAEAFDSLTNQVGPADCYDAAMVLTGDGRRREWATHQITTAGSQGGGPRQLVGLRVLAAWAAWLRDQGDTILMCAELPPPTASEVADEVDTALGSSIGEVVDSLGAVLASTDTGAITTVMRLPVHRSPAGVQTIIDTMDVGDVDAQIYIDPRGRFDPYRSRSDADLGDHGRAEHQRLLSVLDRAAAARDKSAMLGAIELDADDRRALDEVDRLRVNLTNLTG